MSLVMMEVVVVRFGGNGILIVMMINRRRGRAAAAANGHDELERGERGRERQTDFQYTDRLTHIHLSASIIDDYEDGE